MPQILEFAHVEKSFGKVQALRDVSFVVDEGEFLFITGPTGAGKTTILKLLLREFSPSSGQIVFDKTKVHEIRKKEVPALRQKIGTVFQDFQLLSDRTLMENAETALSIKKVPKKDWRTRIDTVLDLVGLSDRRNLFPSQLSGGEIQRASMARALVVNPKLIFADEPTGNLDWETTDKIMNVLEKVNKEGKTVIVTTHNRKVVDKMGKRVIELDHGHIKK